MDEDGSPDAGTDLPPYLHIADVLRQEIHEGLFRVGERIPAQAVLEERFHVSRPTVQRALKELHRDGYIDNQRGRPSEVLDWRHTSSRGGARRTGGGRPSDGPEPAFAALGPHVAEAFQERRVTIDSFSLTAETLNAVLAEPITRVMSGELNPESIRVRILLPSLDASLAIPKVKDDPDADWPLVRLRQLVGAHVVVMNGFFAQIAGVRGGDVSLTLEFRTVPLTPMHKLYLLNGRTALFGYYRVVPRPVVYGEHRGEIWDVLGLGATLFAHRASPQHPDSTASRYVSEAQTWFDSLWATISTPLDLAE